MSWHTIEYKLYTKNRAATSSPCPPQLTVRLGQVGFTFYKAKPLRYNASNNSNYFIPGIFLG